MKDKVQTEIAGNEKQGKWNLYEKHLQKARSQQNTKIHKTKLQESKTRVTKISKNLYNKNT